MFLERPINVHTNELYDKFRQKERTAPLNMSTVLINLIDNIIKINVQFLKVN